MKRLLLVFVFACSLTYPLVAQTTNHAQTADDIDAQRVTILSELRIIAAESLELNKPLAKALAKAEIADASWDLDRKWSQGLLSEAYILTLPSDEGEKLPDRTIGARPTLPTSIDRAREEIRMRILSIASRDRSVLEDLEKLGIGHVSRYEQSRTYSKLSRAALETGDRETAEEYIGKSFAAEPMGLTVANAINRLATQDREAADKLILQYIEMLRALPLPMGISEAGREFGPFIELLHPGSLYPDLGFVKISSPGPSVQRAYVGYVLDRLGALEERVPGSLKLQRNFLLSTWIPLKQYEPELMEKFLALEAMSRRPDQNPSLPDNDSIREKEKEYDKKTKDSLESDNPSDRAIEVAINTGDFQAARRAVTKLSDSSRKAQLIEKINMGEALSLARKGELTRAESLAEMLVKAVSIQQVYPALIRICTVKKDQACATNLVNRAMVQLSKADQKPFDLPLGMPETYSSIGEEHDPVLEGLTGLAKAIATIDEMDALLLLDRIVSAANKSKLDTSLGRTGLDIPTFRNMAGISESRVWQAGFSLNDRLRRIVLFAAVCQWKAGQLSKKDKPKLISEEVSN